MVLALLLAATMLLAPDASAQVPSSEVPPAAATQQLFQAVHDDDLRAVQASVAMGADIGAHDRHGLTPSDIAVDKGFFDIAHFLLSVRNLRLDQIAESGTAATGARQAPPAPVQPLATPGAPAREPPLATARAVMPPPPAPVSAVDETIIRPAGEAPPSVLHDPFDPEIAPLGAVLPIIGPLRGSESPATASAPATAGPIGGETRPPSRAIATEIAETPSERAERSGPIAQEPGDPASLPPAKKGFFRRLVDGLVSDEAGTEADTPSDTAPSPAAPSVSDAPPEASEPPPDRPAPVPVLAEAPPVASAEEATPHVDFEPLPAIDPEIAAIPPAPESPLEPPADGPAPVPVLAEAPPVASAEEAAAEPTPVNRGFFRRLIDRLGSGEAGSEADTPSDPAPSPATPPVSDAGPETSEPPPAPAAVDLRALPMIKPETAAIPPAPALQTGSPDDPVSPPVRAEGPLENTSTPRLTVRASPNSESARPSEPAEIVSATDPFDPNEAPRGAELPIVGAIIGPGTTAEAVRPPPIAPPIAPPVPTTEEASAPPSAPIEEPADTASAATEVAEAAAGTETAAEPTIDAATPATPRASAPAKESSEEITRPGPLGRIYQAVEDLFGASAETEKRPEPRQATVETARLSEEPLEETVAEPRPPPERYLKGVTLAIADALALGARKFPQTPVAHAPENCVRKQRGTILFCVEPVTWPGDIEEHFAVSTFFYRGMNAIVRYEEGESRYIYALFATDGFEAVSAYFRARYGPPTSTVRRRVTLTATPRMTSPAMIWRSADETSGAVTTLEVRKYDDSRGGFADVRHGAILLRREGTEPIFPRLSTFELMVLK